MDRVKEFLSTISHEIRTPLTSIKGFSKTILNSYDNLTDEQKKKFIQIIYEQSQRLTNLVENALIAANSNGEYDSCVFKKTDINSILNKSVDLIKMNYKNIDYQTSLTPSLFSYLDTDKLQQIFVNILDNASKYSNGFETVEIKTYQKEDRNYISIKNFGTYIEEEQKEKIFEKFYRTESYLTSKTQGSGLGLYIVKMSTESMKGEIKINSSPSPKPFCEFILSFPDFLIEDFGKGAKIV